MNMQLRLRPFRIARPVPAPPILASRTTIVLGGDSRELLPTLADNSIDGCVTDPPYALISTLKRFANSPRSEAAMPTAGPYERASRGFMGQRWDTGQSAHDCAFWTEVYRVLKPGAYLLAFGGTRTYHRLACAIEDAGFEIRDMVQWLYGSGFPKSRNEGQGRGTALKPANEPICMARKPLSEGTIAANVLRWGTGAINIGASRIPTDPAVDDPRLGGKGSWSTDKMAKNIYRGGFAGARISISSSAAGRFPANVITDGSEEVVALFPHTKSGKPGVMRKGVNDGACYGAESRAPGTLMTGIGDEGSAARFFYQAKATKQDRAGSKHPTVKPVALMRYLCRLVIPPGGVVLDPFAGTGTTGEAAHLEGFSSVLIEREADYVADIRRRMARLGIELP